jgi:hypothetical protein
MPYGAGPPDMAGVGAHIVRPFFPNAAGVDRAGAQYPQGVRRIRKRQSRQRLRCVRPYNHHRQPRRPLPHNEQRNTPQAQEASRSEAGRAATDAYSKSKDGSTLSRYHPLNESHRRRVRSCAVNLRTSLPKPRRVLWFLGGRAQGLCPACGGAKVRRSVPLSSLLLTFGLCQKSVDPGGRTPHPYSSPPTHTSPSAPG